MKVLKTMIPIVRIKEILAYWMQRQLWLSSYFNYISTSSLCDFMKVSDSISSSDSENATHESKQEGNSRKTGGNDKEEAFATC